MPTRAIKMSVTLSLDANLWPLFQKTCNEHGLTPSHEFDAFMKQRLATLLHLPIPQERDDA